MQIGRLEVVVPVGIVVTAVMAQTELILLLQAAVVPEVVAVVVHLAFL
jgi:hypothetical protein